MQPTAPPKRVLIVGGAGSGKSTLGQRIGAALAAPVFDLHEVAYENGAGRKRSPQERLEGVARIAAGPSWVAEGIYIGWTDALMREADVIVWLDLPWHVATVRILSRHLDENASGTNRHPGIRPLLALLGSAWRYYATGLPLGAPDPHDDAATNRAATALALEPFSSKVVHCVRPSETEALYAPQP